MMYNTPLVLSVSQLNTYVKSRLDSDENLYNVFLVGEISNFTDHYKTGHFYFTLKDENAQIKAVMFRTNACKVKFRVENGLNVIVRGRVSLYEAAGSYQVFVDDMQPDGVGALNLAFEQLKSKLQEEGLFADAHKRPIPKIPSVIGVITSETGAAVQDILQILNRRFPVAQVILAPVLVQGADAPKQLIAAVQAFNALQCADVLIIGRGGGSAEDLWAFNDEGLARAVSASVIPVISAVGHESDYTICDFAADLRAPTPSAAAELAVPDMTELRAGLFALQARLQQTLSMLYASKRSELERICAKSSFSNPAAFLDEHRMRLLTATGNLHDLRQNLLHKERTRLCAQAAKLESLSPLLVLARGYTVARGMDGKTVRFASAVQAGDTVDLQFSDGCVRCIAKETL